MSERCCVCGGTGEVKYCRLCDHNFCGSHRNYFSFVGVWQRGVAALKEFLGQDGTPFCEGHSYPP